VEEVVEERKGGKQEWVPQGTILNGALGPKSLQETNLYITTWEERKWNSSS
jgi:hypothetical protein